MKFDKSYFLDEVREGFLIPSMMKKQWAVCLDDHEKLTQVCRDNGLKCTMGWGNLIGAVRHGGFVPWDDDFDLEMPRVDFEKLLALVGKEEKEGQYHIDDFTTVGNTNTARRWMEKSTLLYDSEKWPERHGFPFGNALDIFILDMIPEDKQAYDEYMRVIFLCESLRTQISESGDNLSAPEVVSKIKELEKLTGEKISFEKGQNYGVEAFKVMDEYLKNVTFKAVKESGDEKGIRIENTTDSDNNNAYKIANVAIYIKSEKRIWSYEKTFDNVFEMEFEGTKVSVPCGYDGLLRRSYGDFMYPAYIYYNHRYPSYDILADELKEKYDFELLKYRFSEEEYARVQGERLAKAAVKDVVRDNVGLLLEAHEYIAGALTGDALNQVLELLGQCQSLAVYMGELIERKVRKAYVVVPHDEGDGFDEVNNASGICAENLVHILEGYCESVFELYEKLGAMDANDGTDELKMLIDKLRSHDSVLKKICEYEFEEYKEIVFLVDRADNWNSLHTIWEAAMADENVNVTVIAVPYKYKDAYGMIPEDEEWEIDTEGLPEEVELTAFDAYDFETMHPDVIIFQNPYDEYSDVVSVHPYFYASNLCKITDKLVFIPPFVLRELVPEDQRGRYTLGVFIKNPGLIYADEVIVQSEQMKDVYVEMLDGFIAGGEDDANGIIDFDSKIKGIGSPLTDLKTRKKKAILDEKTEKTMLFYVSASMLYDEGQAGIDKMKHALEMIREFEKANKQLRVIFQKDKYADDVLKTMPEILDSYKAWVNEESKESDVRLVVDDFDVDYIDAFYGDAGTAMHKCRMAEKQFLWETPGKTAEEDSLGAFLSEVMSCDETVEVTEYGNAIYTRIMK